MAEIGKRIKEIRIKKGLTQEDLAESSKINLRTIQRIENNNTTPRGKTLKLIFDALNIEIIEIEKEKKVINKQLIYSSSLTLLIFICSFLGWVKYLIEQPFKFSNQKIFSPSTSTGWNGNTHFFDYDFQNWFVSISSISIGLIVVSYSLGLIRNKMKYIGLQLVCIILYLITFFNKKMGEVRPSLFIVIIATILLIFLYRKNREIKVNNL